MPKIASLDLNNISLVIICYLGFIRIPCLIQTIHVYHKYQFKSLYLLAIFVVYEEIALGILIWGRVRWSYIDGCEANMMFSVLFGIMYIGFFIIGRAVLTLGIILIITIYLFIMHIKDRTTQARRRRKIRSLKSIKYSNISCKASNEDPLDKEWIIWMEEFKGDDHWVILPCDKNHWFHKQWITSWLLVKAVCPYDREEVM